MRSVPFVGHLVFRSQAMLRYKKNVHHLKKKKNQSCHKVSFQSLCGGKQQNKTIVCFFPLTTRHKSPSWRRSKPCHRNYFRGKRERERGQFLLLKRKARLVHPWKRAHTVSKLMPNAVDFHSASFFLHPLLSTDSRQHVRYNSSSFTRSPLWSQG